MTNQTSRVPFGLLLALVHVVAGCGPGIERDPVFAETSGNGAPAVGPATPTPTATPNPEPPPRTGELRPCGRLGPDRVRAIAAMPDGEFAVGYGSGRIAFAPPGKPPGERAFDAHSGPIEKLAVSRDGAWLLSLGQDGVLRLWDSKTSERRYETDRVMNAAFSRDGSQLGLGGYGEVRLVRLADLATSWSSPHVEAAAALFFSGDGETLTVGTDVLVTYRTSDGSRLRAYRDNFFYALAVAEDGSVLFGVDAGSIALVSPQDYRRLWQQQVRSDDLEGAVFSPDGSSIAYGPRPSVVVQSSDGQLSRVLEEGARAMAFSSDSRRIALGFDSGAFYVLDLARGEPLVQQASAPGHIEEVSQVAVSPDGRLIASQADGQRDETLKVWRASDSTLLYSSRPEADWDFMPEAFAFSPDSTLLARTGHRD